MVRIPGWSWKPPPPTKEPPAPLQIEEVERLLRPWAEILLDQVPGIELFDAHTHIGQNDPDGMRQRPAELLAGLEMAHARGAFVFPMHEPDGYSAANDAVLQAASESDGMLVPFCRVNPHDGALQEAERSLAAGARGIKLHPRAELFTLDHPAVRSLAALANERRLPILIHAGRGIPALGLHAVELAGRVPGRTADPGARGDLRSVLDLARGARPPEPAVRHRLVDARGPGVAVQRSCRPDRSCSPPTRRTGTR